MDSYLEGSTIVKFSDMRPGDILEADSITFLIVDSGQSWCDYVFLITEGDHIAKNEKRRWSHNSIFGPFISDNYKLLNR